MTWREEDRKEFKRGHPEYWKEHYRKNAEQYRLRSRENYQKNKERKKENQLLWNEKNKKRLKEYQRLWHQERRLICINRLGGKCACCGETEPAFLAIDHIDNNGNVHRKTMGSGHTMICGWLIKNNFPPGFQVLCHNCNMAKSFSGQCPHVLRRMDQSASA